MFFENEHQASTFLNFLNGQHPNLNFTIEKEDMKQLLFLDVLSIRSDTLITNVYRKNTFTGIFQNYNSFLPFPYKDGLTKAFIDLVFRLNNTWDSLHLDLQKLRVTLQKNEYTHKLIDKSFNKYLNNKIMNKPSETEPNKTKENIRYFKLSFIGTFSKFTEHKLQELTKQFCKEDTNIKIVFSTFKLASLLSTKDKVPYGLKSYVTYKFLCDSCYTSYVGKSTDTFLTGHMNISKLIKVLIFTNISLKIRNANQFVMRTLNFMSVSFLDSGGTKYTLKLKEGIYIKWLKPSLNKQVKYILSSILV